VRCLGADGTFVGEGGGEGDGLRRLSIASADERRRAGRRSDGGGGGGFTPLDGSWVVEPLADGSPAEVDARTVGLNAAGKESKGLIQ
jgi:hypothetical protein